MEFGTRKHLRYMDFLEKCNGENLENFAETALDFQFFLDDCYQHVNADGDPDLSLYGVFGCTVERFDAQVLFDPFEEQLHLPAAFVELRDGQWRKRKIVGQEDVVFFVFGIEVTDAPKGIGIFFGCFGTLEDDRLIAAYARRLVDSSVSSFAVFEIALGANDEKSKALREGVQAAEIDVGAVHDIECARLQYQLVEDVYVVGFSFCDADKTRDIAAQVYQCVQFDGGLAFAKSRPGEQRKTKIDGGGIEGISGLLQVDSEAFLGIQLPGDADQNLGEVGIDTPVSFLVCPGQSVPGNLSSDAGMVEFGLHGTEACFYISEAFPIGDLCERHAEKLIETRKSPGSVIASISSDATVEFPFWQEVHQLRENDPSRIHRPPLSVFPWKKKDQSLRLI